MKDALLRKVADFRKIYKTEKRNRSAKLFEVRCRTVFKKYSSGYERSGTLVISYRWARVTLNRPGKVCSLYSKNLVNFSRLRESKEFDAKGKPFSVELSRSAHAAACRRHWTPYDRFLKCLRPGYMYKDTGDPACQGNCKRWNSIAWWR